MTMAKNQREHAQLEAHREAPGQLLEHRPARPEGLPEIAAQDLA